MERVHRLRRVYSVEKLSDRDRRKNPTALESLKFPRAEGTAAFDDLRAQIRSVRYTSRFPRVFGRISIQLKNRLDPRKEFFNRIDPKQPDATVSFAQSWHSDAQPARAGVSPAPAQSARRSTVPRRR